MDNKKNIEETLKEKIDLNEKKIQSLFNFKLKEIKNEPKEHIINNAEDNDEQIKLLHLRPLESMSQQTEKSEFNNDNSETKSNYNSESMSLSIKNNECMLSSDKKKNKNSSDFKKLVHNNSNIPLRKTNKINEKFSTINYNYNYNYNNYHNNNYNYNFNFNNKNKKITHKPKIKIMPTKTNNNFYNKFTDTSKFKPLFYHASSKKNVNFNEMYERFEENLRKNKEKIERLKIIQEEKMLEQCSHQPTINRKDKNMGELIKDDFLTRQQKFNEKTKQKEEKLKQILLRNEQIKINKNNYLLLKRRKKNLRIGSVDNLIERNDNEFISVTRTKSQIDNRINKLYEWDQRRKEKIERKREEEIYEEEKNDHIPKIDKRSSSLAYEKKYKSGEDIFERLSKEDKILKEKRKLIAQITSPTFKPNFNLTKNYKFKTKFNNNIVEDKYFGTNNNCNNNDDVEEGEEGEGEGEGEVEEDDEILESSNESNRNQNKKMYSNDKEILEKEMAHIENDKIIKMYRNAIFGKKISKLRLKSFDRDKSRDYNIYY